MAMFRFLYQEPKAVLLVNLFGLAGLALFVETRTIAFKEVYLPGVSGAFLVPILFLLVFLGVLAGMRIALKQAEAHARRRMQRSLRSGEVFSIFLIGLLCFLPGLWWTLMHWSPLVIAMVPSFLAGAALVFLFCPFLLLVSTLVVYLLCVGGLLVRERFLVGSSVPKKSN